MKNCDLEVKLNQELAPDIYLGMIPLVCNHRGDLQLGHGFPEGEIVDWLVWMRRFPDGVTICDQINHLDVNDPQLIHAASSLCHFYKKASPENILPQTYLETFQGFVDENHLCLSRPRYGLDLKMVNRVHEFQFSFLSNQSHLLMDRAFLGKIIEGHGDLRPEHICLTEPPIIVDRLEFSKNLRILDPWDELSYFFIECAFLNHPEIGNLFLSKYLESSHDEVCDDLLTFYKVFRASLRAKISAWHMDDARVMEKEKYLLKARKYISLANLILEQKAGNVVLNLPVNLPPESFSSP